MLEVACVILAAGFSRRFGEDKLLQPLANGGTVIESTVSLYQSVFDEVIVVTRKNNDQLRDLLDRRNISTVLSENAGLGMSQSIIAAVRDKSPDKGWLMALADMPFVAQETVSKLAAHAHKEVIVQPLYEGQAGNPVFIGSSFKPQLLLLEGDVGAKNVINNSSNSLVTLECGDPGVLQDIDKKSDLLELKNKVL